MSTTQATGMGQHLATYKSLNTLNYIFSGLKGLVNLQLFEGGLIQQVNKNESRTYTWDNLDRYIYEIKPVRVRGAKVGEHHTLTIKMKDGSSFFLNNYFRGTVADFEQFSRFFPVLTVPTLMERNLNQLNSGQAVQFGKLSLTHAGFKHGDKELAWGQAKKMDLLGGFITIYGPDNQKGKPQIFFSQRVAKIPNYFALVALVRHFCPQLPIEDGF